MGMHISAARKELRNHLCISISGSILHLVVQVCRLRHWHIRLRRGYIRQRPLHIPSALGAFAAARRLGLEPAVSVHDVRARLEYHRTAVYCWVGKRLMANGADLILLLL